MLVRCAHLAIHCQIICEERRERNAELLEEVTFDSDTNGKKMLHSFFVNGFLFYFLIFLSITSTFAQLVDSTDDNDETIVEGKTELRPSILQLSALLLTEIMNVFIYHLQNLYCVDIAAVM